MQNDKENTEPTNPRFVWLIGDIREVYPDCPESMDDGSTVLWDRQERKAVVTVHKEYAQAHCLELTVSDAAAPFTTLEAWFNRVSNEGLESENIPPTGREYMRLYRVETLAKKAYSRSDSFVDWYWGASEAQALDVWAEDCHRYGLPESVNKTVRLATAEEIKACEVAP